jgi:hypothetical protein
MASRASTALPIARNTALLSAALATHSAMLQLTAAGLDHPGPGTGRDWAARPGTRDRAHREGARGGPGGALDGPLRSRPGTGGRLRGRRRRLRARRTRQCAGRHGSGAGRPGRHRHRQRRHPARPNRGRRHVPAPAQGARHRPGALWRGVRRDPRTGRLQPPGWQSATCPATRWQRCGWPPPGSSSSGSRWSQRCAPTPRRSRPSCATSRWR